MGEQVWVGRLETEAVAVGYRGGGNEQVFHILI
jgi:hypothetical protein